MDAMIPPCEDAADKVRLLRIPMYAEADESDTHDRKCIFPADGFEKLFKKDFVLTILKCHCETCKTDKSYFDGHPDQCADRIVKHATSLFALLARLAHPMLVVGILYNTADESLASSSTYTKTYLRDKCWPKFYRKNPNSAVRLLDDFEGLKRHFLMEKIDGTYREYPEDVILPFARRENVGKKSGHAQPAQGNFGILYKFEIPEHYREFELPEIFKTQHYSDKSLKFARKALRDTSKKPFWVEEQNLGHIQRILQNEPDHFVQMLKAYRHGDVYNIIFPCAEMNLDDFFRDPENQSYCENPLRGNPLWKEMLGICRALKHMVEGQGPENGEKFVGYHFDLKPANILIFGKHTWQIADFGQSVFRERRTGSSMKLTNPGGTDEYAPPENADPEAKASAKYDVWSMGCILLELTAFLVMKEPPGIQELDKARHTKDDHGSDHRLWTKTPTNQIEIKSEIKEFIDKLPAKVGSDPEAEFVGRILNLIRRMLVPDVKERCSASEVVAALEDIVGRSTESSRNEQLSTVPVEPRLDVASPPLRIEDLSNRSYLHLGSPNGTAEGEAPHSNIYQLELTEVRGDVILLVKQRANSERPRGIYNHHAQRMFDPELTWAALILKRKDILKRKEDLFVPLYAFGIAPSGLNCHLHFYVSRLPDLQNTNNNISKLTDTPILVKDELIFATSSHPRDELGLLELTDVLAAQTVFTTQEVVEYRSYRLEGFTATEYQGLTASIIKGKKAVGKSLKKLGRAIKARSATEADSSGGVGSSRDTGSEPAENSSRAVMVQIWREQKDEPRRRVVIFKQDGSMFVIRMMKEWREIESKSGSHSERHESPPGCVTFVPTKPAAMPTFDAAILVRRQALDDKEQGLAVAGIPMHPEVLANLEDQNQKRYTKVELTFGSEEDATEFRDIFKDQKKDLKDERDANNSVE